jgi:pyruvate/2-oxoacid:ferredoxin oxidoreductase beta subunit/intein/homing endonuclease
VCLKIAEKKILGFSETELFAPGHSACAGCGASIVARLVLKTAGADSIVCNATGCVEVFSTPYPKTSWNIPWIHSAFENAAAVASGVDKALKKLGTRDKTNLIVLAGDGGTFDIGLGAISGAFERGHKMTYVCYDNEAYMNCLSHSCLIMTAKGLKKITEVKKGELVYAFDQKKHRIVTKKCAGVFDNGKKKVYELSTFHHNIKATANHPFLTLQRNGRGEKNNFVWKTLQQLKKNDEIVVLKKIDINKSYIFKPFKISKKGDFKVNKIKKIRIPEKSNSEMMEFLGLFMGDGWVRVNKCETGFALPEKTEGRNRVVKLTKQLFGTDVSHTDKFYVHINSINLARFIDSLGFGKNARTKTIPGWVFMLPEKEKLAFLKGLMLSDGYSTGKSHRYVSASFDLLRTLRLFLQTMNFRVGKIHKQKKVKGTFVVYRKLLKDSEYGYVCFSKKKGSDTEKYPSQSRFRNFFETNKNFDVEKITDISYVGVEPTLDLRVEDEHNFIADGMVVHNTGIQRSGATPLFANTTTTPAGKKIHGKANNAKDLPFILAAHHAYVATANIAFPQDLAAKLKKSFAFDGPSYIQVFAPCPTGWKHPSEITVDIAKLAFNTNIYPLFEIENGVLKLNLKPSKQIPVKEYLSKQGRFKHLSEEETALVQKNVDENWQRLTKLDESKLKLF